MKQARLFLLASFTASYAAIQKQQSVQLFLGVAPIKFRYGSLCRLGQPMTEMIGNGERGDPSCRISHS